MISAILSSQAEPEPEVMRPDMRKESMKFSISAYDSSWDFIRPADPDLVLARITDLEYEKDQFLPFWAEHWPSAEVLLDYCLSNIPDGNLLFGELGAGLGIVSSILAANGHFIVSMDISPSACRYASANILRHNPFCRVLCCDWRYPPFVNKFDRIIASDILYEKRWITPILAFLKNHLEPRGHALIADPMRNYWQVFKDEAAHAGFNVASILKKIVNDGKTTVEVLKITL
jgi:SAM-dependent methyltransferase